jgi:hypothetical protein
MPNQNDEWSQYEVKPSAKTANAPAPKKDEWNQYEVAPQESAPKLDLAPTPGKGTYRMSNSQSPGSWDTSKEVPVSYDKVKSALDAGYKLHADDTPRYQKDSTHEGQGPTIWEKAKTFATRATEPIPDRQLEWNQPGGRTAGGLVRSLPAALTNVGNMVPNAINATARGVAGLTQLPAQAAEVVEQISQGDPRGVEALIDMTPMGIGVNLCKTYQSDVQVLGPNAALSNLAGNVATLYAAGKIGGKLMETGGRVADSAKGLAPRAARTLTGTGPDVAVDLAKKTEKANALKERKTVALNTRRAEVDAGRAEKVKAANDAAIKAHDAADKKLRDAHVKHQAEKAEVENINKAAAAIPDARAGLESHAKDLTEQADVRIEKARHDALEEGNTKYNTVNEQLNPLASNQGFLQSATLDASEKIKGSNTSVPILKDMERLIKTGDVVNYETLQGYYSELGREIVKGTLPGDVYHALDTLHESIGNEMQRIADSQGLGTELKSAREYWRRMKQTFGDTSDAISDRAGRELKDNNPDYIGEQISEYRQRLLGSFDPQIPNLLKTAAKALERLGKLPTEESARKMIAKIPRPPEATVVPPPGTKPVPAPRAPLLAEKKTISAEDLTQANRESLAEREKLARTGHSPLLTSISVFDAIRNGMEGNWAGVGRDVAARGLYEVGKQGFAAVLRNPSVIEFLSKPTAEQIAKIPPDLRGPNLKALLDEAKGKGIKVDPRLYVVAAASASQLAPRKNATDEWAGQ